MKKRVAGTISARLCLVIVQCGAERTGAAAASGHGSHPSPGVEFGGCVEWVCIMHVWSLRIQGPLRFCSQGNAERQSDPERSTMAAASTPSGSSSLCDRLLANWRDETLQTAAKQCGIVRDQLQLADRGSFLSKDVHGRPVETSEEVIELRYKHHCERRVQLAEELQQRWSELLRTSGAEGGDGGGGDAGASTTGSSAAAKAAAAKEAAARDVEAKLAADVRKMENMARRRQEEIQKMLDFQVKKREAETRAAEQREAEMRKAEETRKERQRLERQRLEEKRQHEERKKAAERELERQMDRKMKQELARQREKAREDALAQKQAKKEAREREEERKALQKARQQETERLFEEHEARIQRKAAENEERKRQNQLKFQEQQSARMRLIAERQEKAKGRIAAARQEQERMARAARAAYEERERQMALKREEEAREHEIEVRKQRERQLGMSLRRGRILETMRQQEATRVFSLIDRMGKQEEAMEAMAEERRRLAELREEQRRLRQQDRMDNIERMMRAKDFHNRSLNEKFAEQDEREAARKAAKRALIESHKQASLEATFQRQELVDRLAKARGMDALLKLSSSLTAGGVGQGSAGTLSLAESAASTREPASQTPRPPAGPKVATRARPSSARTTRVVGQ